MGGIWIRSQDKTSLVYCKRLTIVHKLGYDPKKRNYAPTGEKCIQAVFNYSSDYEDSHSLGTYESKERAIEVIDSIQELLTYDGYMQDSQYTVYQMPAE